MRFPPLIEAVLVRRDNRFRATVRVGGKEAAAHVANSGRLAELLQPGARVWVGDAQTPGRRTPYDLVLAQHRDELVSVDARVPNALFREYLVPAFASATKDAFYGERRLGESRIDFELTGGRTSCWVEVKSVTLVRERLALFPDAPTLRGARHVRELEHAVRAGARAAVVFIVQRGDATAFAPHVAADPAFTLALASAARQGVAVRAFRCCVSLEAIALQGEIPVIWTALPE